MVTQRRDDTSRTGLVCAHVLERLMNEFIADIQDWSGLRVDGQRDPDGRLVSNGYHWHEPNERRVCDNLMIYGYPTPLAALNAGLQAKLPNNQMSDEDGELAGRFVTRCKIPG